MLFNVDIVSTNTFNHYELLIREEKNECTTIAYDTIKEIFGGLDSLLFPEEVELRIRNYINYLMTQPNAKLNDKDGVITYDTITYTYKVEINSLIDLVEFTEKVGKIILDRDTITIYNGYIE